MSASSLSAFRAAIVRSVWSSKMPLVDTPIVLNLLDGVVVADPAFHIVWTRFRLWRRYLAQRSLEVSRICRMLDLIAQGPPGHGPVHLILISAEEIGFVWDGSEQGWIRVALSPSGCLQVQFSIFRALFWRPGSSKLVLSWLIGKCLGVPSSWTSVDHYNNLPLPTCVKEIKCC